MVPEVLEYLDVAPARRYVDGTAGGGGHTTAILEASAPDGQVLAIDRDPEAIETVRKRLGDTGGRLHLVQGNYGDVARICEEHDYLSVDGLLVDAGVSSHQFDEAERGFSFSREGPLDMRMGPDAMTVAEYLASVDLVELRRVLSTYGEIRSAHRVAESILEAFDAGKLETTTDLADVVEETLGWGAGSGRSTTINPSTLVFQGLRIAVNRELETLEMAVNAVSEVVASGGRAVFISFHSLEDRIVKHGFRELANDCICPKDLPVCGCDAVAKVKVLTSKPIYASDEEVENNPRARSARLRAVEVL
jgi:16S rRNA (cytosine1402-N4)-methyltransferase